LASVRGLSIDEPSVQIDAYSYSILGISAVVHVIAIPGVVNVYIIVVIPVIGPIFGPRVHYAEPEAAVLEAGIASGNHQRKSVDAESVTLAKVAAKSIVRNPIAVVASALLPTAVLIVPPACAVLHPHAPPVTRLHEVQVDADGYAVLRIPAVIHVIAVSGIVDVYIIVFVPVVGPVLGPRINDAEI
jgi:hypothetical protein